MKKIHLLILTLLFTVGSITILAQPITGTKTIPGDYATVAAAVTALNTNGVGTGGVTFNVSAGHSESTTSPILLLATGTASDPIVFQKNGAGLNPLITRTDVGTNATSTLGGQGDAVIIIEGSDYVIFDAIDVAASDAGIEYGYYLRKVDGTNGCKNVTIKNALIDLTKGTSAYVVGIYSSNNDAASLVSSATGITVTSTGGRNENVTITGNTIQDVFAGIVLRGYNHTAAPYDFYDQNFIVGATGTGNIIQNYAGNSAATSYGVYLIYQNNANISYNNLNNIAGGGSGATSILYGIFNSVGTLSNFIANQNIINLTTSATASALYGINNAGTGNLTIDNNSVTLNATVATSGVFGYIYNSSAAASLLVSIGGNTIVGSTIPTTGSTYLIYNNSSQLTPGVTNVQGNSISGVINRTGATGTTYCYYNNGSPTATENIFNNVFDSVTTTGTGALYGILSTTGSSHTHNIYNNIIREFSGGTGTVYGIHRTLASGSVYNNLVYNLTGGGTIWGLSNGSGNLSLYKNSVYNLNSTSTGTTAGLVSGIYISALTNFNIYNNFISDLKAPSAASIDAVRGINSIATSTTATLGLYFNSIYLNASSTGTDFGSSGIYHTYNATATTSVLDMRNNIVVNASTAAGTGLTVAFRRSASTSLVNYSTLSNNNDFYAGTPGPANLIFYDGTNADQTLASFKTRVSPRESNSVTELAPFVNTTTAPYNLHLSTSVPTQLESGGVPVTSPISIVSDFDGDTRDVTTPDIGADEFNGILLDLVAPNISYTPLLNTSSTSARVLVVTISDASGVPATAPGWPNLYWKKINNITWNAVTPSSVSGSNYTYNFGAGVTVGDTIQYYVVAQDSVSPTPNIGAYPALGASGFTANPPAASTPPTSPSSYFITPASLSGDYTVGTALFNRISGKKITFEKTIKKVLKNVWVENPQLNSKNENRNDSPRLFGEAFDESKGSYQLMEVEEISWTPMENGIRYLGDLYVKRSEYPQLDFPEGTEGVYATITAAVADLNLRGVSGAVNFLLTDTLYSAGESFPILASISNEYLPNSTNKVTFKPNTGVTAKISGSSTTGIFVSYGTDYIIFDGSNSGGTDRSLTIENTYIAAANSYVLGIFHNGSNGAKNNTIKNCVVKAGGTAFASWSIILNYSGGDFDNTVIQNNEILRSTTGMQFVGVPTGITNGGLITKNIFGSDNDAESIGNTGLVLSYVDGLVVTENVFKNFKVGTNPKGINIITGTVNTAITKNLITRLTYTGTGGYGGKGIDINTGLTSSNLNIENNVITSLSGDGWSTFTSDAIVGIRILGSSGGINIYHNSVNLFGNADRAATATVSAALYIPATTNINIRNNIFSNSIVNNLNAGSKSYAIYNAGANTVFAAINYNDYYASGTQGILGFQGLDILTLAGWQTATGGDANSLAANPMFTDSLNLRPLLGSPVIFAGTPIAGITTDFLGLTRTNTPSIGAYEFPVANIGWANLQWPGSATVPFGQNTTAYGQIWVDGITNGAGQAPGISAWLGYSTSNSDPATWTNWIPATFNVDVGNNDEYMANIGATLTSGTYYYAYRWQLYGGSYYYGGFSAGGGGQWNGTTNISGVLTVQQPPLVVDWERSAAGTSLPTWFSPTGSTERGLAWGMVNVTAEATAGRVIVPSRNGGTFVKVLDDTSGADLGDLSVTGISGGTFVVNDAEVDLNGKIYVCNLTTNASTDAFKVYRWNTTSDNPKVVLSYLGDASRLGDKFTVAWDSATGLIQIYAASSTDAQKKVYKWTQIAFTDSFNQVPTVITLSDAPIIGGTAAVGPLPNGSFYWKSNGQSGKKYSANGTLIGTIPGSVLATGANAVKFIGIHNNAEYIAVFQYGAGNNNARVIKVPNGDPTLAETYGLSTPLGTNANANGTGDVAVKGSGGTTTIFALATNNGLGGYIATQTIPVELTAFAANVTDRNVTLTWKTASETNTSSFAVERNDNSTWRTIGSVQAAGNSTEIKDYSFTDKNLNSGNYSYRLRIIDLDGSYEYSNVIEVEVGIPLEFSLSQNYPNPFNPATIINFALPFESKVTVQIYSITGELVETIHDGALGAGYQSFSWNASRFASGVYIYRLNAQSLENSKTYSAVKKMMLMK